MKKALYVNIGSVGFTIDEDAYQTLDRYYADIRSRLYESDKQEIMEDIEARTADIFRENLNHAAQVVDIRLVKRAIAIIGSADTFGERKYDTDYTDPPRPTSERRKLYRSRTNSVIGGVCGGLAVYFNQDATLLRVLWFLMIFLAGIGFWAYLILWIVVPLEPRQSYGDSYYDRKNRRRTP